MTFPLLQRAQETFSPRASVKNGTRFCRLVLVLSFSSPAPPPQPLPLPSHLQRLRPHTTAGPARGLLTRSRRPNTVTWPRACSLRCRHSTRFRPLSMGSVTFLLPTVGLTVPASRWGSVCSATSMPLASSSRREPSAPM